ncbi:unnamed protein product [Timema podura]|uniref:HTH psq-type domain-containing protein n=1 Tax=Timema podura TaxID=61482 RepID=A0ABN7NEH7_TIMPD|nr:unnamed protein product [Timema podura]
MYPYAEPNDLQKHVFSSCELSVSTKEAMGLLIKGKRRTADQYEEASEAMTELGKLASANPKLCATDGGQIISLAYMNLEAFPCNLVDKYASSMHTLDLTDNKFRNVDFLSEFVNLNSLILDHNSIDSDTVFPALPNLELLWLNNNQVSHLFYFINNLQKSCPNLHYLSLMGNTAVLSQLNDGTFYDQLQYRLFVISWFDHLVHLDDQTVTNDQRLEAERLFKRPLGSLPPYLRNIRKGFSLLTSKMSDKDQLTNSSNQLTHKDQLTRKRKVFTIGDKILIIRDLERGTSQSKLARELNIQQSTVSRMWKNRDKIISAFQNDQLKCKRLRSLKNGDDSLSGWLNKKPLALQPKPEPGTAQSPNETRSQGSQGWLQKFAVKHNVVITSVAVNGGPYLSNSSNSQLSITPNSQLSITPNSQLSITPNPQLSITPNPQLSITPNSNISIKPSSQLLVTANSHMSITSNPPTHQASISVAWLRVPVEMIKSCFQQTGLTKSTVESSFFEEYEDDIPLSLWLRNCKFSQFDNCKDTIDWYVEVDSELQTSEEVEERDLDDQEDENAECNLEVKRDSGEFSDNQEVSFTEALRALRKVSKFFEQQTVAPDVLENVLSVENTLEKMILNSESE